MIEELKEAAVWCKDNKGKVIAGVGTALLVNDIGYPIVAIGTMLTGYSIDLFRRKKKRKRKK